MKYSDELKYIDTQEKAYFLGQIYGDGYNGKVLRPDKKHFTYRTELASINDDIEVYQKLEKLFPFMKLKHFNSHKNVVYLMCCQKKLYLDLLNLGMISNKTKFDKTLDFHFPNLDKELIPHFIRGYFDADGSAYYPTRKRSRNNLWIEFGCATKNFLLKLKEELDKEGINLKYVEKYKKAGNGKYYTSYILFSSNYRTSKLFADYIYRDATIYLDRKYKVCNKEPELKPTAGSIYGNCPYCGSLKIKRNGYRNNKARLRCSDCNKHFTRPLPK